MRNATYAMYKVNMAHARELLQSFREMIILVRTTGTKTTLHLQSESTVLPENPNKGKLQITLWDYHHEFPFNGFSLKWSKYTGMSSAKILVDNGLICTLNYCRLKPAQHLPRFPVVTQVNTPVCCIVPASPISGSHKTNIQCNPFIPNTDIANYALKYHLFRTLYINQPSPYYGIYRTFSLPLTVSLRHRATNSEVTEYKRAKNLLHCITKKQY